MKKQLALEISALLKRSFPKADTTVTNWAPEHKDSHFWEVQMFALQIDGPTFVTVFKKLFIEKLVTLGLDTILTQINLVKHKNRYHIKFTFD